MRLRLNRLFHKMNVLNIQETITVRRILGLLSIMIWVTLGNRSYLTESTKWGGISYNWLYFVDLWFVLAFDTCIYLSQFYSE